MELIAISIDTSFATMVKGKTHSYIKREPTGKPKPKYRYWYRNPRAGIVSDSSLRVGSKFRHGSGDDKGHYTVTKVDGDQVTIQHDELDSDDPNHTRTISVSALKKLIHTGDHTLGEDRLNGWSRRKDALIAAWKNGTDKQVAAREKDFLDFAQGYWGKTENTKEHIADIKRTYDRRGVAPQRPEPTPEPTPQPTPESARPRRPRLTGDERQEAIQRQQKILDDLVDSYRKNDSFWINLLKDKWAEHREQFGNLVGGYREKVAAARAEAKRIRDERQALEKKAKAAAKVQEKARKLYAKHKTTWARKNMPTPKNDTSFQLYEIMTDARWKQNYKNDIATFAGATVDGTDTPGRSFRFDVYDENNKEISHGLSRSFSEKSISDFGTIDSSDMDRQAAVFDLHNNLLAIHKEMRGGNWNAQKLYARQEDWLKEMTRNFSEKGKANVVVTINAALNVGKYYWATQGFRYKTNYERLSHLNGIIGVVNAILLGANTPLDENGDPKSIEDHGWDLSEIRKYRDYLQDKWEQAGDSSISNDDQMEPWELLANVPEGPPIFKLNDEWREGDDPEKVPKYIKCNIGKYAMLSGYPWDAVKHIHGPTERDKQGIAAGDRNRGVAAMRDAKAGKPWEWLGDSINEKLAAIQKSLLGFVTRLVKAYPEARSIRFSLAKATDDKTNGSDSTSKNDDGIRADNLLSYEDEQAILNLVRAENGVSAVDNAISLFDEILSTPDEPKEKQG